jgi:hypothetical protein
VALGLPARSRTTVLGLYRTGLAAPWPSTDYRLAFQVIEQAVVVREHPPPTRRVHLIRPARPGVAGGMASRISLRARPALGVRLGHVIVLSGRTNPPVPDRWIRLRFKAARRSGLLAWVQTDRHGRFAYRDWRAAYRLDYEVSADFGPRAGPLAEPSCSLLVAVGRRGR